MKTLSEQFCAKPSEIHLLFRNQLDGERTRELQQQITAAGLTAVSLIVVLANQFINEMTN